ncbi:MAG: tRNA pseudouridine(38-40) synthase TruA [bacterium]
MQDLESQISNFLLRIEYDGAPFCGWQSQRSEPTVQAALEEAIFRVTSERVRVHGAGRTDSGVHALGQAAHVNLRTALRPDQLLAALNSHLPPPISVWDVRAVPLKFDARKSARLRTYRYHLLFRRARASLQRGMWVHFPYRVNLQRLRAGAAILSGEHDFSAFRSAACTARRTRLTLQPIEICEAGERVMLDFRCRSFLHHMIRLMVGALLEVARGRLDLDQLESLFKGAPRPASLPLAPAHGLVLMDVYYPPEAFDEEASDEH